MSHGLDAGFGRMWMITKDVCAVANWRHPSFRLSSHCSDKNHGEAHSVKSNAAAARQTELCWKSLLRNFYVIQTATR